MPDDCMIYKFEYLVSKFHMGSHRKIYFKNIVKKLKNQKFQLKKI